jgi:hypothetical protein
MGALLLSLAFMGSAGAATVAEREYQRGYADCLVGQYDQYQHGASYKRGCRAAEDSGKTTGHTVQHKANANLMRSICDGAVTGKFNPHARVINIQNVEHQNFGWGVYGIVALDDGSTSNFVCMFSSSGVFKRVNASEPSGAISHVDHENYCPVDVSEADRYKYPGCN